MHNYVSINFDLLNAKLNYSFTVDTCNKIVYQVISGIIWYHFNNICLRKFNKDSVCFGPEDQMHVIITNNENAVYITPGESDLVEFTNIPNSSHKNIQAYQYYTQCASPESYQDLFFLGFPHDIWSLGIVIYHIYANMAPFNLHNPDILKTLTQEQIDGFVYHEKIPEHIVMLLKRIFIINPGERITANEMYSLPYIQEKYETKEVDDPMKSVIKLREIMTE